MVTAAKQFWQSLRMVLGFPSPTVVEGSKTFRIRSQYGYAGAILLFGCNAQSGKQLVDKF